MGLTESGSGWFLLYRQMFHSATFKNLPSNDARMIMIALICEANFEERRVQCQKCQKEIVIGRGEAWVSQSYLAKMANTTRNVVRTTLSRLQRCGFAKKTKTCHYSDSYLIANYAKYQDPYNPSNSCSTSAQHLLNSCSTAEHHNHKETLKKLKKEKKETFLVRDEFIELATSWAEQIKERNPNARSPNLASWSRKLEELERIDHQPIEAIRDAIDWVNQNNFWQKNCISPENLRRNWDKITAQMNSSSRERLITDPHDARWKPQGLFIPGVDIP